jgi:REP element-mobilizing transposase RayT
MPIKTELDNTYFGLSNSCKMGQSLSQLYIHLVFGTKFRRPYIKKEFAEGLHSYMGGILNNMECHPIKINSMPDHIHILFKLSKNFALAKVVEAVKKDSSLWMKQNGVPGFVWQIGYGAFSVSDYKVEVVKNYIVNQERHHKKRSFEQEIEAFFKSYQVAEYQKEYFWR